MIESSKDPYLRQRLFCLGPNPVGPNITIYSRSGWNECTGISSDPRSLKQTRHSSAISTDVLLYVHLAQSLITRCHYTGGQNPPFARCGGKKIPVVETMNNVAKPTRCRQPFNSVRLMMVCCIVHCLHEDFFTPTLCKGGGPRHLCTT